MKYKIEITETLQKIIEIEAKTAKDALQIVDNCYRSGDIKLQRDTNIIDSQVEIYDER